MHRYRTHTCGQLSEREVGATVRLSGWVHRKRDHGNLLFLDLRDHYGITQCVIEVESDVFPTAEKMRPESVVRVDGKVVARTPDTVNTNLSTGRIEIRITEIEILSQADELPIQVFGDQVYPEDMRLRYRFLDLRREKMHRNIMLRTQVIASIRRRMNDAGFTEFSTPILTASSPEGARDFLVPSRLHPGKFYALPQAPQQFKQLLMVAGFDRYFQIAPCFRDEDPRADRAPGEFYQLDVEMSFVEQEDVFQTMEPVIHGVFEEFANGRIVSPSPFVRIPYKEALLKYGSDKPDLRNPIVIADVTEAFNGSNFQIFAKQVAAGSVVRAIPVPGGAGQPRSFFDKMNEWARGEGAAGLGYIVFAEGEARGPVGKQLDADRLNAIRNATGLKDGDAVFFACAKEGAAAKLAGLARIKLGEDLDLLEKNALRFCWVVDYPMYEWNEDEKKIDFSHNPFSMPQGGLEALESKDPLQVLAYQYDIVCNGIELCSGAIRNHRPDTMIKAFGIAGYPPEEVEKRFGGMLNAFKYGAPPHGGMAPGIDRMVMMLADEPNIREVILFPMNQRAEDPMMGAPSEVPPRHMRELSIRIVLPDPKPPAA